MKLPSYPWRFAHLAALWAYGISQPVFSMLKGNPEFLVVRGSTRTDVIVFAVLLVVVPPVAVVAVEFVAGMASKTLSAALHIVGIWCFGFLALLQIVEWVDPARGAALLIPIVPAAMGAFAYLKWEAVRSFLSISLALPVAGALLFVGTVPLAIDDHPGAEVDVAAPAPIVLVILDEFPLSSLLKADGSIDQVRYPSFARLAREGTWYPRATTVHEFTTQAVPAVLTGRLPRDGELPTLSDHPENLFTLLGEKYAIHAQEQVTVLCPSRYCPRPERKVSLTDRQRGLMYDAAIGYLHGAVPRSLRGDLPPIGQRWGGFGSRAHVPVRERVLGALDFEAWLRAGKGASDQNQAAFASFLRALRPVADRPTLNVLHLLLPHSPWRFFPSGNEHQAVETVEGMRDDWTEWRSSGLLVEQALQEHLLQVGYTDRLIGLVLKSLETTGLYDRALVIVTADHGMSFRAGSPPRKVTRTHIGDIAAVPLFVKYPVERRGRVDRRDVKTIDIVPTIADVIGVRMPWRVDGRSLLAKATTRDVSVGRHDGGAVTASSRDVHAGVVTTARRNALLFGEGTDSMYRLGPHKDLLGRSVASLDVSDLARAQVRIDGEQLLRDVQHSSRFLPARVTGTIDDVSLPDRTALAIAVNGRVVTTTRSYSRGGRTRFVTLVPESAFLNGANTIEVFTVGPAPRGVRLVRLGGTRPTSFPTVTSFRERPPARASVRRG
jgi:hypothetical protein